MNCPSCDSTKIVKNGFTHSGKQNHLCNACGRQFVLDPIHYAIPKETINLVDRLLLEKIPLAGIARTAKVSESWLQKYVNEKYETVPQQVNVILKKKAESP